MAPPPTPPWLFSERDDRDLRRLKKPLFLDSRFFSAASWTPGGGAFAPGSLEEEETEEFGLRQDVTSLPATGPGFALSPEAQPDDLLAEEVIQAFVQFSHHAVLLRLWRHIGGRGGVGGTPLRDRQQRGGAANQRLLPVCLRKLPSYTYSVACFFTKYVMKHGSLCDVTKG